MKSFIKGLIVAAAVFTGLFVSKPYSVHAASTYTTYQEQFNVSASKVWKINFSAPVNLFTAQNSVYVYDSKDNPFPVTVTLDSLSNTTLVVTPVKNYDLGKRYYMVVGSDTSTLDTYKHLNKDVRMYFNISSKPDPINNQNTDPNAGGIVIVGKDRAYSINYLLQHSDIANDINGDPTKKVYYVPDSSNMYYQDVQNIFGGNVSTYLSMSDLYKNGSLSDTIVYTDGSGNNYTYVWSGNIYVLQKPSISASVNLTSTVGAVSLTVNSVIAVPGATYYKIDGTNVIRKIGDTAVFTSTQTSQKIDILTVNQSEMGYAYVNVSTGSAYALSPVTIEQNTGGNTTGNSNNNGSAVLGDDGYTYYLNSGDNDTIYRTDNTGIYNIQISLDRAQYMNESNGWLYYSNYSDNEKIYRIRTDGTRREKVCDDTAAYLVVYGDWIYYSNHSQGGKLYKIGVAAGASTKDDMQPDPSTYTQDAAGIHGLPVDNIVSSQAVQFDEVAYINVVDNWIYYVNNSDDHKIYKVDLDGNFRTKVSDDWATCPQVVDGEIYYCSNTGEIMKIDTNGDTAPVDLGAQVNQSDTDQSFHINVSGDWIYYSNKSDNKYLYKVKTDGSGEKYQLTSMPINYVITAGNYLYIVANKMEYTLPIDTTGSDLPTPVTKTSPDNGVDKVNDLTVVVNYADVNQNIQWIEDKYLPDKVSGVMVDDTIQELTVSWDKINKTFSNGIYTYTGTILGYNKTVKLQLIIPSEMLNGTNDIKVINNPGSNDIVKISPETVPIDTTKLNNPNLAETPAKPGDIIRIYGDNSKNYLLGKGTVGTNKIVTISGLDLDSHGDDFYITIQRVGKYESDFTKVVQMEAPVVLQNTNTNDTNRADVDARDNDSVCVGADGRDFTIYGWNEAHWGSDVINSVNYNASNDYDSMYIIQSSASLDMSKATPVNVKGSQTMPISSTTQIITLDQTVKVDSLKQQLNSGYYSIYISRHYSDPDNDIFVTADPNGSRPMVTGDIATINPAAEQVTAEGIPNQPIITGPSKANPAYANDIMVTHGDLVTLSQPISTDQEVWFVPSGDSSLISNIRAWRAQDHIGDTRYDNMDDFYGTINKSTDGSSRGILKVGGSVQQNNFNVDNIDPSNTTTQTALSDGVSYYVFVVNNVGASLESTKYITADYTAPTIALVNPLAAGQTAYGPTDTIKVNYTDVYGSYKGTPGTIYVLPGTLTGAMDLQTIQYSKLVSIPVTPNNNASISVSQLSTNDYTIYAVDAAGNISKVPIYVKVVNNNGGGYIPSN
ncbi:DUF5050 domain-containing protein [Clostridium hydrogenum]|uniref:DUF5050 domain-containing protein n=1 Tax=Clostridium hydrogenum TaxID=2855764 RepID=UPI002E2F3B1A|nr:DUF5050 domain-containing protein [Clostridium hydrogenum]